MKKLSFQFWLDISFLFRLARHVNLGVADKARIAQELEVGMDKAVCFLRWAELLGLVEKEPALHTTGFWFALQLLGEGSRHTVQLLYAAASRRHLITSFLVNDVAYPNRAFGFTTGEAHDLIDDRSREFEASAPTLRTQVTRHLRGLTHGKGFGGLGLFRREGDRYQVTCLVPSPLVAAHIIYTNWPRNTAKVTIRELASGRNSLGRIFFLDEMDVMVTLRRLEERNLVKIETVAGLNQVGINQRFTPDDFLAMLAVEGKT